MTIETKPNKTLAANAIESSAPTYPSLCEGDDSQPQVNHVDGDAHTNDTTPTNKEVMLKKFGVTPERIQLACENKLRSSANSQLSNHRQSHIDNIRTKSVEIMKANNDAVFFSALSVLQWLTSNGLAKTADGRTMVGANAIGDVLGRHGMNLPYVMEKGKKCYSLLSLNNTPEENAIEQGCLNSLTATQRHALKIA